MSGYAKIVRETCGHHLFVGNAERLGAWFWLVTMAAWKDTHHDINGKTIIIKRGQLATSRKTLSEAWGWSPSKVERYLTRLKTEQMIEQATGQGKSVITICNYEKYQDKKQATEQATEQATGQRSDSDRTTKEEDNKIIEKDKPNGLSKKKNSSSGKSKARAHSLPEFWRPQRFADGTQAASAVEHWPDNRFATEVESFISHHRSKGSTMVDWQAAWRTWVLNSIKFGGRHNGGTNSGNPNGKFGFSQALEHLRGQDDERLDPAEPEFEIPRIGSAR